MSLNATQQKLLLLSEGSSDAVSKLLFGFVLPAPRRVSLIDVVFLILERLRVRLVFARQLISSKRHHHQTNLLVTKATTVVQRFEESTV